MSAFEPTSGSTNRLPPGAEHAQPPNSFARSALMMNLIKKPSTYHPVHPSPRTVIHVAAVPRATSPLSMNSVGTATLTTLKQRSRKASRAPLSVWSPSASKSSTRTPLSIYSPFGMPTYPSPKNSWAAFRLFSIAPSLTTIPHSNSVPLPTASTPSSVMSPRRASTPSSPV